MRASMPRQWPQRRASADRICCDQLCSQGHNCPLYERSDSLPIPLGVCTGEHRRPKGWLARIVRWLRHLK